MASFQSPRYLCPGECCTWVCLGLLLMLISTKALAASGTVVAWGPQVIPAVAPGTRFKAIAAGDQHNVALKNDGTIIAWGYNKFGGVSTVPGGLSNVVAIAAGGSRSLALKNDGTVVGWGYSSFGATTEAPHGLNGVVAIAAGGSHSLALKNDGTVVAWGRNVSGESTVPEGLSDVVA